MVCVYGRSFLHKITCQITESIPLTTLIHTDENLQCLLCINSPLAQRREEVIKLALDVGKEDPGIIRPQCNKWRHLFTIGICFEPPQ